ncbi:MAG: lycopene cyclase domain-containing protein [Flavobacteriales bacterium]|jgi:lycopene cyclase domain-containing protein|nr:lycopene cyclase domain-containing protein [Flavobacteriales bacterium]
MERWYYLGLDLFSIAFPLAASFEPRIAYWRKWRGLFTGIGVMMVVFVAWDAAFTAHGVWGFSDRYTLGVRFLGLPIEEWLFFVCVPYACVYLYEVMRYALRKDVLGRIAGPLAIVMAIALLIIGLLNLDRFYTAITFISAAAMLALHALVLRSAYLGRFFIGYALSLVPFFLVNGVLTGWLLPEPIVWYDDAENLGIRLGTIPVEDSVYLLFFLLLTITFHERALKRAHGDRA